MLFAVSLLGALGSGCFEPKTQEGLLCSPSGACPTGQSCTDGVCYQLGNAPTQDAAVDATQYTCTAETLAGGQNGAHSLAAEDANLVYWTAEGSTVVLRSPKVAGQVEVFHDSGVDKSPFDIASDEVNVYWTEKDTLGRLMRKTKDSATIDPAVELAIDQGEPSHLALDNTHVYWSNSAAGTINRVLKGGGAIEGLATGQGTPTSLVIDATRLYWVNSSTGQIMRSDKNGLGLQQLAGAQGTPSDITISNDTVFWTATDDNEIRSVGKDGGAVSTVLTGQMGVTDLTVNDNYLYYSNHVSGEITRLEIGSTTPQLVVAGQAQAVSLVFAEALYWLNAMDETNRLVRASCNSL